MRRIPKEKLLCNLIQVAKQLDKTPTQKEYIKYGLYNIQPFVKWFGSWNKALEKVDLHINLQSNISKKNLLDDLKSVAIKLNKTPT